MANMDNNEHQQAILEQALTDAIEHYQLSDTYGLVLIGLPAMPITSVIERLGNPSRVYVSLVGADNEVELRNWAESHGWSTASFGFGATHAVQVRNTAPAEAIKLVFVWHEEERLHSLTRRGYQIIGPHEVISALGQRAASQGPNVPQRELWDALTSPELAAYVTLDNFIAYYDALFGHRLADSLRAPSMMLPWLGLLPPQTLHREQFIPVQDT